MGKRAITCFLIMFRFGVGRLDGGGYADEPLKYSTSILDQTYPLKNKKIV